MVDQTTGHAPMVKTAFGGITWSVRTGHQSAWVVGGTVFLAVVLMKDRR